MYFGETFGNLGELEARGWAPGSAPAVNSFVQPSS